MYQKNIYQCFFGWWTLPFQFWSWDCLWSATMSSCCWCSGCHPPVLQSQCHLCNNNYLFVICDTLMIALTWYFSPNLLIQDWEPFHWWTFWRTLLELCQTLQTELLLETCFCQCCCHCFWRWWQSMQPRHWSTHRRRGILLISCHVSVKGRESEGESCYISEP